MKLSKTSTSVLRHHHHLLGAKRILCLVNVDGPLELTLAISVHDKVLLLALDGMKGDLNYSRYMESKQNYNDASPFSRNESQESIAGLTADPLKDLATGRRVAALDLAR